MSLPKTLIESGIHQSHMQRAFTCLKQLWFTLYSPGEKKQSYVQLLGTSGHLAIQTYFEDRIETGLTQVPQLYTEGVMKDHFMEHVQKCKKDPSDPMKMLKKAQESLTLFLKDHAPKMKPKWLEKPFSLNVGLGVKIEGAIDYLGENGLLSDFKFRPGQRVPNKNSIETDFQLTTYSFAAEALGEKVKRISQINMKCNPDQDPKVVVLGPVHNRSGEDWEFMLKAYSDLLKFIDHADGNPDLYPMTNPSSGLCSRRWCEYASRCPRFGGSY